MSKTILENDSRYPYTYSCDFIRCLAGYSLYGMKISRSDASQIRSGIAEALGMDDVELAQKLSDYYKANENTILQKVSHESSLNLSKRLLNLSITDEVV